MTVYAVMNVHDSNDYATDLDVRKSNKRMNILQVTSGFPGSCSNCLIFPGKSME